MPVKPDQALRMQIDLKSTLDHPDWTRYCQAFLSSMYGAKMTDEKSTEQVGFRTPYNADHRMTGINPTLAASRLTVDQMLENADMKTDYLGKQLVGILRHDLALAETYIVTENMNPLIRQAAADWPQSMPLEPHMVPSEAGFMVFEKAWDHVDIQNNTLKTKAVIWRVIDGAVALYEFSAWSEPDDVTKLILEHHTDRDNVARLREMGDLSLHHMTGMRMGTSLAEWTDEGWSDLERESAVGPMVAVMATWALMQQTLVDVQAQKMTDKRRAGWQRKKIPGRISVITLRRRSVAGHAHEGDAPIWDHKWTVRGHWRNQAYGPGRSERRWIYVHPHVKGNLDAPWLVRDRVNRLSR